MPLCLLIVLLAACTSPEPAVTSSTTQPPPPPAPEPSARRIGGATLPFADEGAQDPSFAQFRERLRAAVAARDIRTVVEMTDPKIRTSFGAVGGVADFRQKLERSPDLWNQLETILSLGGTFRGEGSQRSFWAPYVYSSFPDSHDAFTTMAVVADDVPLRGRPAADAPVIALLSRNLVEASPARQDAWIEVKAEDGTRGWVERKFVRSPVDYRAGFMKAENGWKMNAFVAGD